MSEQELARVLHGAVTPAAVETNAERLWSMGQKRRRHGAAGRTAAVAAAIAVVVGAGVVAARGGNDAGVVQLTPGQTKPQGTVGGTMPERGGARSAPDADLAPPDFPMSMALGQYEFRPDGNGSVEVQLSRREGHDLDLIRVAIPLTFESWDDSTASWTVTHVLYDMSGSDGATSWRPVTDHPEGWSYRTFGNWGIPIGLPLNQVAVGSHRVCLTAWPDPDAGTVATQPRRDVPVPATATKLCREIRIVSSTATSLKLRATIGNLVIPKLEERVAIYASFGVGSLDYGVAHVATTPACGEKGAMVVVGHRTTYTAPFRRLDELRPGDTIEAVCNGHSTSYTVRSTTIVDVPDTMDNYDLPESITAPPTDGSQVILRLVTYEPLYSARQRLVVEAEAPATG